jgi:excisionase family DNA binding protein
MSKAENAYKVMLTDYPDVLSAAQTAKILGIDRHFVYRMIEDEELFAVKIAGKFRIPKYRLIEYLLNSDRE